MTTVVCWNMRWKRDPWRMLVGMGADVAVLQECCGVPHDVAERVDIGPLDDCGAWDPRLWESDREFPRRRWPKIAKLSNRVEVKWFQAGPPDCPGGRGHEQQFRTSAHAQAKGTAGAVAVVRASTGLMAHRSRRRRG